MCQEGSEKFMRKTKQKKGGLRVPERGAAVLPQGVRKGFNDEVIFVNRLERRE